QSGGAALRGIVQKSIESGFGEFQKVRTFVDKQIKPAMEGVQSIPTVTTEIRKLKTKIEELEKKLSSRGKKKK
ncbi:MAG: hypothetical protein Q7S68_01610, partial [Deltaproteobacteria bacterium]|nr:hypothetical protein [Deltaproteobacteria bacterium]